MAHKFWKIYMIPPRSSSTQLSEVEFRSSVGGPNIATGGTVSGVAVNPVGAPANLLDSNTTTVYGSNSGGGEEFSVSYEFPSPVDIVEILVRAGSNGSQGPPNIYLRYSDDGVNWVTYSAVGIGLTWTALEAKVLLTPANINGGKVLQPVRNQLALFLTDVATWNPPVVQEFVGRSFKLTGRARLPYRGENFKVQGNTTQVGEPVPRRVNLYDQASGQLVDSVYTGEDGAFLFDYIAEGNYTVVGVNPAATQNSVIYAHITAVPR